MMIGQASRDGRGRIFLPRGLAKATIIFQVLSRGDAGAARSIQDACGAVDFASNQAKHYGKSEFIKHAGVAENVGELLAVFKEIETHSWTISPQDLKEIVLKNINRIEGTQIYGSAIAFEPDLWNSTEGLEEGVPYPAVSDACLDISLQYCEHPGENTSRFRIDSLAVNDQGEAIYCPYAYQGSPSATSFANCSRAKPHFCPTMDLARAYDYSDTHNPDVEWYTAPRCLFFRDGIRTGYWTSPYFDAGAGNINMVTYSQPIVAGDTFLGIATIDIEVERLCYGNQCNNACPAEEYNYTVSECQGSKGDRTITYTTSDPSCPIDPDAMDTLSCSYVAVSSAVGISLLAFGALGAVTCLAVLAVLIVKRDSVLIQASQLNISIGFVGSGFLTNVSTFAYVGDHSSRCGLTFWAAVLPVTMQLAFLFGKIFRTYKLFSWARQMKRKKLSDAKLLTKIAVVISIQIGLLILWTVVEDPTAVTVEMDESADQRYCIGNSCHPTEVVCQTRYNIIGYFPLLLLTILVIAGCVMTFQSRQLPNCFCEAKHVMFAMYTVALVSSITLLVILVGGDELPVTVRALLLTVATCTAATWSVLVIFLPKFLKLFTTSEDKLRRDLKSKVRRTASSGIDSINGNDPEREGRIAYGWESGVSVGKDSMGSQCQPSDFSRNTSNNDQKSGQRGLPQHDSTSVKAHWGRQTSLDRYIEQRPGRVLSLESPNLPKSEWKNESDNSNSQSHLESAEMNEKHGLGSITDHLESPNPPNSECKNEPGRSNSQSQYALAALAEESGDMSEQYALGNIIDHRESLNLPSREWTNKPQSTNSQPPHAGLADELGEEMNGQHGKGSIIDHVESTKISPDREWMKAPDNANSQKDFAGKAYNSDEEMSRQSGSIKA